MQPLLSNVFVYKHVPTETIGVQQWTVFSTPTVSRCYNDDNCRKCTERVLGESVNIRLRLGPHERTKCVRCNALCDFRCRNRKKPIDPNIRVRACLAIGFFLFLQRMSQSALQRTHFVRSCGPSLSRCSLRITTVRSRYQGTTGEDTADCKDLACALVIFKVWRSAMGL
jgi:hypothetical protein